MEQKIYKDSFSKEFTQYQEFLEFLYERERNSHWERHESKTLELNAMDEA